MVFAMTHALHGDERSQEVVSEFFSEVLEGVPFRRAVAPLLEDWSLLGGRVQGREGSPWQALARLSAMPESGRREQVLRQRLILKRALPGVEPEHLWAPVSEYLVPEHIPSRARAQKRWFKVMASMTSYFARPGPEPRVHAAFLRWLSAHAENPGFRDWSPRALYLAVVRHRHVMAPDMTLQGLVARVDRWWAEELALQAAGAGLPPPDDLPEVNGLEVIDGEGPPERLPLDPHIRRMPWPDMLKRLAAEYPDQETRDARGKLDLYLHTPFPGCDETGLKVRPLGRASELREEGRSMQHCAARYLQSAVTGETFFFHAVARGMALTIEIRGPEDQAWFHVVLGHRNRPVDAERRALVLAWWERVARAHGLTTPRPQAYGEMPDIPF
jgi:hypothetical protein